MSASFTVNGSNITIKIEYTAPIGTMQSVLGDAAEYLWIEETDEEGNVTNPFADATNQEKLNVLDAYIKSVIVNLANTHKSIKAQKAAREAEEQTKYEL